MKRLALVAALLLASVTTASAQTYNWSGFYWGLNAGYGMGDVSTTDTNGGVPPGPFDYSPKGFTGGAQIGVNQQFGMLVLGAEIEGGYMKLTGTGLVPSSNPIYHQDLDLTGGWYGMAVGRLGIALDRTMIYGKGGYAYWGATAGQTTTKPGYETTRSSAMSGFVYGAGVEQALGNGWSLRVDWTRMDFGSKDALQTSITDPPIGFQYTNTSDVRVDTIKGAINFKF